MSTASSQTTRSSEQLYAPSWRQWCRLCAKNDENNANIFLKNEVYGKSDVSLSTAVGKYFWITVRPNDNYPTYLCRHCRNLLISLITFTERVNKVQSMYWKLDHLKSDENMDPEEVRLECGILDDAWDDNIQTKDNGDNDEAEVEIIGRTTVKLFNGMKSVVDEGDEFIDEERLDEESDQLIIERDEMVKESMNELVVEETLGEEETEQLLSEKEDLEKMSVNDEEYCDDDINSELQHAIEIVDDVNEEQIRSVVHEVVRNEDQENDNSADECDCTDESFKDGDNNELLRIKNSEEYFFSDLSSQSEESVVVKRKRGRPRKNLNGGDETVEKKRKCNDNAKPAKYICRQCNKKYKNPTSYRKHMIIAHETKPDIPDFQCDKCGKILPTEKQLALHMRLHLSLEERLDICCPLCNRMFSHKPVLKEHIRTVHNNEKKYVCDQCGRCLKTLGALNDHKLIHTNDTPYECDVCQKCFKNKARLRLHAETHTKTTHKCSECGLQLNTRRTLKMHMLVHTDIKQFSCDFCNAQFKRSKALKNHLLLHTGLRPYVCNFCGKSFSNGSNCRSHKRKLHPKELAEEETKGYKTHVSVPNIDDLRSCSKVKDPREVKRHAGGLPLHLRALLIAAEERHKRKQDGEKEDSTNDSAEPNDDEDLEETVVYEIIRDF